LNKRLSVSDKYSKLYHLATQGTQNSFPSPRGDFCGLRTPNKVSTTKLKCETLEITVVFINPCSVLSCNL